MKKELSSERMDALLHAGEAAGNEEVAGELDPLRTALADLRGAASAYAAAEWQRQAPHPRNPRRVRSSVISALATAAIVIVACASAWHARPLVPAAMPVSLQQQTMPDDVLLNSIGNDLAATVPEAMRPLAAHSFGETRPARVTRKD